MADLKLDRDKLQKEYLDNPEVPEEQKAEIRKLVKEIGELYEENPLQGFYPHSSPQREFGAAQTPIQAAFAGNRFGKTTSMVVKALCQVVDEHCLPERLKAWRYRGYKPDKAPAPAAMGRVVVPDLTSTLEGVLLPAFRKWTPRSQLRGGSFDKAWDKTRRILYFENGSWIQCMTYEMDLDKFGGAAMHFIAYDEPPPKDIRTECLYRLADYGGFEMFAMTPLMGIGWIYRDIFKKRESPDITVIRGSMHDNPTLDQKTKDRILEATDETERKSREFGDFAHFGGMIYSGGFEHRLIDPPNPDQVQTLDIVVGIDPGMRNAAFIWGGFDQDNRCFVFDEVLLQDKTPADYMKAIRAVNHKWGIRQPLYVIDPSARNRSLVNAESVESELQRLGIFPMHGQNDVEVGVQNIRRRIQYKAFWVSRECRGLRDEAEEYRVEDRPDGEFKPVKENDHRLDATRYLVMTRAWDPAIQQDTSRQSLGFQPGRGFSQRELDQMWTPPSHPLGAMT